MARHALLDDFLEVILIKFLFTKIEPPADASLR